MHIMMSCHAQILLVDDDDFNLFTMPMLLKDTFGFEMCDSARDGRLAVSKYYESLTEKRECGCKEAYLAIFMDTEMPVLNGY